MYLCAIFLTLSIGLTHIFASPPNPLELSSQTNHDQKGYECGNVFFPDLEVKRALIVARGHLAKGYPYPYRYQGNLYSDSNFVEYFLFPIRPKSLFISDEKVLHTVFRVVFRRDSIEVVDVVAKVPSGHHAKCIWRDSAHIGPSPTVPDIPNSYQCADKFFTEKTIDRSVALAQTQDEKNPKYPFPYKGLLYPQDGGYLMWPIMRGEKLFKQGSAYAGPFFLILDKERKFVDVVINGYKRNYLRCIRSRKPLKVPASDQNSKLIVSLPRHGYACGKNFFNDDVLKKSAEIAKRKASKAEIRRKVQTEYYGPPFHQNCLIWPIIPDGSISRAGIRGPFRLILTPEYEVMSVALYIDGKYKRCERAVIMAKKNHDTSNYDCYKNIFTHQQLVVAAEKACEQMTTATRKNYPASYEGSGFEKKGPYLTYPVHEMRKFSFNAGLHRVVLNTNCEIVGALTTLKIGSSKKLVKCHRIDDGPLPPEFFGANAEPVSEHKGISK